MDSDFEYGIENPPRPKMKKKFKDLSRHRRMEGLPYMGYDSKGDKVEHTMRRPPRTIGLACKSLFCFKAKNRNCSAFTKEIRQRMFNLFWKMSWEQKRVYICNLITETETKQKKVSFSSQRAHSVKYFLKSDAGPLQVCRKMFLSTLGLKEKMVRGWRNQSQPFGMQDHPSVAKIKRKDRYAKGKRCLESYKMKLALIQFLENLPKLDSHYCRKDTSKMYFENDYQCKSNLYREYVKACKTDHDSVLSLTMFFRILKKYNYALHKPRKDQCDTCCAYKAGNLSIDDYEIHQANKAAARTEKEHDLSLAKMGLCILLCMDSEAVKLIPQLKVSLQYYKMKLKIHNATIYNILSHESTNYVWDEANGELVASIFTTIVIHHLQNILNKDVNLPIILYSDGCGYQNRNMILSNALLNFAVKNKITITQKYLEKGHTQMECDSSHALIERQIKNKTLNLPSDFIEDIKKARQNPFPLDVVQLSFDFFKNYEDPLLNRYSSIRPGNKAGDPKVNDLRVIKYDPDGTISFKIAFADEYQEIPHTTRILVAAEPLPLYKKHLPISEKKYKHLQDLKPFLPETAHEFYDNLSYHPDKPEAISSNILPSAEATNITANCNKKKVKHTKCVGGTKKNVETRNKQVVNRTKLLNLVRGRTSTSTSTKIKRKLNKSTFEVTTLPTSNVNKHTMVKAKNLIKNNEAKVNSNISTTARKRKNIESVKNTTMVNSENDCEMPAPAKINNTKAKSVVRKIGKQVKSIVNNQSDSKKTHIKRVTAQAVQSIAVESIDASKRPKRIKKI